MTPFETTVNVRTLRNQISAVLREVEAGATFTVVSNGRPVAELRAAPAVPARRRFVPLGEIGATVPGTDPGLQRDLDAVVDDEPA